MESLRKNPPPVDVFEARRTWGGRLLLALNSASKSPDWLGAQVGYAIPASMRQVVNGHQGISQEVYRKILAVLPEMREVEPPPMPKRFQGRGSPGPHKPHEYPKTGSRVERGVLAKVISLPSKLFEGGPEDDGDEKANREMKESTSKKPKRRKYKVRVRGDVVTVRTTLYVYTLTLGEKYRLRNARTQPRSAYIQPMAIVGSRAFETVAPSGRRHLSSIYNFVRDYDVPRESIHRDPSPEKPPMPEGFETKAMDLMYGAAKEKRTEQFRRIATERFEEILTRFERIEAKVDRLLAVWEA